MLMDGAPPDIAALTRQALADAESRRTPRCTSPVSPRNQ